MIAALGVIAIVGSGGGLPELNLNGPFAPTAMIEPSRTTVQVGATVTFTASAAGTSPISYQWGRNGVDIAGATGKAYTLVGANLADDGAQFSVRATNSIGASTASSLLRVSSSPGVVYGDGDFLMSDWTVTATADPSVNGPTHTESRSATGGNPGAFRSITYQMPQGPSSIRVFHTALSATYDPALLGAIYTIDFARDCNRLSTATTNQTDTLPAFEQGGRWFTPKSGDWYCVFSWQTSRVSSLRADEFDLVKGPGCGVNEACPDFSASAAPIRFGLVTGVNLPSGEIADAITQGIDNWNVTVWRR
jgi:hypothetical protein